MNLIVRQAKTEDGNKIWSLIKRTGTLDLNSEYCYFMLSDVFSTSCAVVADKDSGAILGFVSCLPRPQDPTTLFVWQICVAPELQGKGFATTLLRFVIDKQTPRIQQLETTISDDNVASQNLFKALAKSYNATLSKSVYIDQQWFHESHETEYLYTIKQLGD